MKKYERILPTIIPWRTHSACRIHTLVHPEIDGIFRWCAARVGIVWVSY